MIYGENPRRGGRVCSSSLRSNAKRVTGFIPASGDVSGLRVAAVARSARVESKGERATFSGASSVYRNHASRAICTNIVRGGSLVMPGCSRPWEP